MRIGIPRESRPGETLVAATAKTASQLAALGYDVVVEQGAGAAADQPDVAFTDAGVRVVPADEVWSSDVVVKVNAPTDDEIGRLRPGATVISLMAPARSPELVERLSAAGRDRAGDGRRAAHLAGPVDGRAVVDGQRRRLPRGDRVGPRVRPALHRPGHRCGQGAPGPRVRRRGRRRRAGRHRCGRLAGRDRARLRRTPRGRRAGRVDGRRVRHRRHGAGGLLRRLRQGDDRRAGGRHRRDVRRGGARRRHRHHHRADPGSARPAARHRGDGRGDAPRLGRGRHGRRQRRQRRRHRRPTSASSPPTA